LPPPTLGKLARLAVITALLASVIPAFLWYRHGVMDGLRRTEEMLANARRTQVLQQTRWQVPLETRFRFSTRVDDAGITPWWSPNPDDCQKCGGRGQQMTPVPDEEGTHSITCPTCKGTGKSKKRVY